MKSNKNLTIVEQLKAQTNIPKTETRLVLEQEDLYPDLVHEDVSTYRRGYGPMAKNESRWCSNCAKNVTTTSSAKFCPDCGTAFGTVAKTDNINKQIDTNRKKADEKGGTYEYYEETGTKPDGTDYTRKGTSYTAPK